MTPEQFAYWLQGFAEIKGSAPSEHEWKIIKDHLATVFKKVTPTYPPGVLVPRDTSIPPYNPGNPFAPYDGRPVVTCSANAINTGDLK